MGAFEVICICITCIVFIAIIAGIVEDSNPFK